MQSEWLSILVHGNYRLVRRMVMDIIIIFGLAFCLCLCFWLILVGLCLRILGNMEVSSQLFSDDHSWIYHNTQTIQYLYHTISMPNQRMNVTSTRIPHMHYVGYTKTVLLIMMAIIRIWRDPYLQLFCIFNKDVGLAVMMSKMVIIDLVRILIGKYGCHWWSCLQPQVAHISSSLLRQ